MYIVRKKHTCKQINQNFYFKFSDMLSFVYVCRGIIGFVLMTKTKIWKKEIVWIIFMLYKGKE